MRAPKGTAACASSRLGIKPAVGGTPGGTAGIMGTMHELTWIDDTAPLPATRRALGPGSDAPGLLCAGGRLSTQRLEEAYRRGVFPWYGNGQPVLWWTPDPRMVLP